MKLYHGTNHDFYKIDLSKSFPYKDFGKGFYLTTIREQAERMARRKTLIMGGSPVVQTYECEDDILDGQILRVLSFKSTSNDWAEFIFKNRNKQLNYHHDYDIVIGPVADDGVAYLIDRFQEGSLSSNEFSRMLRYKKLSNQYCFCTQKAISYLRRV